MSAGEHLPQVAKTSKQREWLEALRFGDVLFTDGNTEFWSDIVRDIDATFGKWRSRGLGDFIWTPEMHQVEFSFMTGSSQKKSQQEILEDFLQKLPEMKRAKESLMDQIVNDFYPKITQAFKENQI